MTTERRYGELCKPLELRENFEHFTATERAFIVSVHSQMILFVIFAMFVGAALFLVVPRLSAGYSSDGTVVTDSVVTDNSGSQEPNLLEVNGLESADGERTTPVGELEAAPVGNISPIFTKEIKYWEPKIIEWSGLYNLDPDIIATIMQIESCGDPGAASFAGAQGLFQVMPFHFDPGEDMFDPDTNAMRGMAFYNRQLEFTGWDIYLSFAGYNGGYAASGSSYPYWANETQRYYTWAKGIFDDAKAGLAESPALQQWLLAGGGSGCERAAQRLGL
jgi:hypothetical protein